MEVVFHINIKDITDIYISHQHADHCGGLEEIAFGRYDFINLPTRWDSYKENPKKFKNYTPRLIADEVLLKELWDKTLSGGMRTLQTIDAGIETFFEPYPVRNNSNISWCGWKIELVQMVHFVGCRTIQPTFGLFMSKYNSPNIFFTTDSQYMTPQQLKDFYNKADIIFQDCELIGVDTSKKVMNFCSGVHANFGELAGWETANNHKLHKDIKGKMWLTHYQDFKEQNKDMYGNKCDWEKLAQKEGFNGFLKVGQVFDFNYI